MKRCPHCSATFTLSQMRAHPTYRVEPDIAGDPDAVMLEAIDCLCLPYGRATLAVEASSEIGVAA